MHRSERGVGTLLTAGACAALVIVAWTASVVVGWVGQASAVADAADLTALAAAGAQAVGEDACRAADGAAQRNGTTLVVCRLIGDQTSFVVEVSVTKALHPVLPGVPGHVERFATAGSTQ